MGKGERTLACWSGYTVVSQSMTVNGQMVHGSVDVGGNLLLTDIFKKIRDLIG